MVSVCPTLHNYPDVTGFLPNSPQKPKYRCLSHSPQFSRYYWCLPNSHNNPGSTGVCPIPPIMQRELVSAQIPQSQTLLVSVQLPHYPDSFGICPTPQITTDVCSTPCNYLDTTSVCPALHKYLDASGVCPISATLPRY